MEYPKVVVVVTSCFIVLAVTQQETNRRGPLRELFNALITADETLMYVYEEGNEDCQEAIRASENPRVILDIDRPVEGDLNRTYTYIICEESSARLGKMMEKLMNSTLFNRHDGPRERYYLITKRFDIEEVSRVFSEYFITLVTLLERQNEPRCSAIENLNALKSLVYTTPNDYVVFDNVIQVPKLEEIVMMVPPWMRKQYPHYLAKFDVLYDSVKMMAKALNATPSLLNFSQPCVTNFRRVCLYAYFFDEFKDEVHYERTESFLTDSEVLAVPISAKKNTTQSIIFVFAWVALAILILIFFFVVLICWLMAHLLKEGSAFQTFGSWVLISTQYVFGFAIYKLPQSHSIRILLMVYIFYSLQVSYIYQSYMTSVLTEPEEESEVETLEDLVHSDHKIMLAGSHHPIVKRRNPAVYEAIKHRVIKIKMPVLDRLMYAYKHNQVTYIEKDIFRYAYPQIAEKFSPIKYMVLTQKSLGFWLQKGHYFLKRIQFFNFQIAEGGFRERILTNVRYRYGKSAEIQNGSGSIYLEFKHLKEVFLLCFICASIAAGVLLGELLYFYLSKKVLRRLRMLFNRQN